MGTVGEQHSAVSACLADIIDERRNPPPTVSGVLGWTWCHHADSPEVSRVSSRPSPP